MFEKCELLKNIEDLKYLDITNINNFSCIFIECLSQSHIKPLQNWNVSKGK